jgi:hypothetical protein
MLKHFMTSGQAARQELDALHAMGQFGEKIFFINQTAFRSGNLPMPSRIIILRWKEVMGMAVLLALGLLGGLALWLCLVFFGLSCVLS